MAETNNEIWRPYLPDYVSLYYVDYNDNLRDSRDGMKLISQCLSKNNLYPLSECVCDWWDYPEGEYIREMREAMEADDIEWDDEWIDDIREALWDKDESEPVNDLLRNTGAVNMFYSLNVEVDGWHEAAFCNPWRGDSETMAAYKMRRALKIQKGTKAAKQIESIVANAPYGGDVRIYFSAELVDMLSTKYDEHDPDFKTIHFKGTFAVALYNSLEGSGDYEEIELDLLLPFDRDNLAISDSDRYSLESCFGMSYDWLRGTDVPKLSLEAYGKKKSKKPSKAAQMREKEAEYDRVFKAGGCSLGDTDFRRHRDVYYDNNFPCGHHCPHCGQFWVD